MSGDDPHATALLALIDSTPQAMYDGQVPSPSPDPDDTPYIVVYVTVESVGPIDVTGLSAVTEARAICHCVGSTAAAARTVAAAVRGALLNVRPSVTGRVSHLIRQEQSRPPQPDETTGRLVMDQIDVYVVRTEPG